MEKTSSDHVWAVIKAGIEIVPFVGGSIASLIDDYIPTSTQRNIERAVQELNTELGRLQSRLDPAAVDREEFAELFKSCYLIIVRTHHEERRRAAVRLIANILLKPGDPERLSYAESDHFVRCLDFLSIGALEVLGHSLFLGRHKNFPNSGAGYFRFTFNDLQGRLPSTEPSLLLGLVGELNAVNLLHQPGIPGVRDEGNLYGNYAIELTILGARFGSTLLAQNQHVA